MYSQKQKIQRKRFMELLDEGESIQVAASESGVPLGEAYRLRRLASDEKEMGADANCYEMMIRLRACLIEDINKNERGPVWLDWMTRALQNINREDGIIRKYEQKHPEVISFNQVMTDGGDLQKG